MSDTNLIQKIKIGENEHPFDAITLGDHPASDFQDVEGLVTSVNSSSDDEHYPSAKCVYEMIYGSGSTPEPVHDYSLDYLTFNITGDGDIGWVFNGETPGEAKDIQYSKNGGEWVTITATNEGTLIPVETGDIVRFKGNNSTYTTFGDNIGWNYTFFNNWDGNLTTAEFTIEGNIMSLIYGDNFIGQTTLTEDHTFEILFYLCTGLTSAENLILPATTLTSNCYNGLFALCSNLTTGPSILPATELAQGCYGYMFDSCSSLTTSPILPAETLEEHCYEGMFYYCTNLNYIDCSAIDMSAENCTNEWVEGVAEEGTFVQNPEADWEIGTWGIPEGWVVEEKSGLTLSKKELYFPESGGSLTIVVNSEESQWSATVNNQWISLSANSGNTGETTITITTSQTTSERQGSVTFTSGNGSTTLSIIQSDKLTTPLTFNIETTGTIVVSQISSMA